MSGIQAERVAEDLKALEDAFAQYSESLVTRRLVRDLGASRLILAAIDQDIERRRGRSESAHVALRLGEVPPAEVQTDNKSHRVIPIEGSESGIYAGRP